MAEDTSRPTIPATHFAPTESAPRTPNEKGSSMAIDTIDTPETVGETAGETPAASGETSSETTATKPSGAAQLLKDGAAQITKQAGDKAKTYVEDGKARAGGALDELAKLMTDAAGTVDEKVG